MKKSYILCICLLFSTTIFAQNTDFVFLIKEANIQFSSPTNEWRLKTSIKAGKITKNIFSRDSINKVNDPNVIPTITVSFEDSSPYGQDVEQFTVMKMRRHILNSISIDEILSKQGGPYLPAFKNSFLYKCHYNLNGIEHSMFIIHILNKTNQGIELVFDAPNSTDNQYIKEFSTIIKTLEEVN